MINKNNIILEFYKENPQLFFLNESWLHKALEPIEYQDTVVEEPKFDLEKDEKRQITPEEAKKIKVKGKFSKKLIDLAVKKILPVTVLMLAMSYYFDKKDNNSQNASQDTKAVVTLTKQIEKPENKKAFIKQIQSDNEIEYAYDLIPQPEYEKEISTDSIIKDILEHEGYASLPYPDEKQWSIGYGTRVSDSKASFLTKDQAKKLRKQYNQIKSKVYHKNKKVNANRKNKALKNWVMSKYRNWENDFYQKYKIPDEIQTKNNSIVGISKETAKIAADSTLRNIINKMSKTSYEYGDNQKQMYFDVLPSHIKKVFYDLAYNMGLGFLDKFVQFNNNIEAAAVILTKDVLTNDDIQDAEMFFKSAANELLYNYKEDGSYKNGKKENSKTSYHKQNKKRALTNFKIMNKPIDIEEYSQKMKKLQKEHKTLRSVYKNLFS